MRDPERVQPALVVLAAGASQRLGTCKALVDLGPGTALELLVGAARTVLDGAPLIVTGRDHAAIARAIDAARAGPLVGARALFHAGWAAGRSGGLARAAHELAGRDLVVAPIDVPAVGPAVFAALERAWREAGDPARGWLAPWVEADGGARAYGHPIVIGRELAAELARLAADDPDLPLRELRGRAEPLLGVRIRERAILDDLDRPEDLERLRRGFHQG